MELEEIAAELDQLSEEIKDHGRGAELAIVAKFLGVVVRRVDPELSSRAAEIFQEHAGWKASLRKRLKRVRAAIRAYQEALSTRIRHCQPGETPRRHRGAAKGRATRG
jgi:hypothetical protein